MAKLVADNSYSHEELLALANEAEANLIVRGQSYTAPNGITYTSHNLDAFRRYKDWLQSQISSASGRAVVTVYAQRAR